MRMPRRPALGRQPARQCTAAALREVCQRNTTHRKSRAACAFADAGAGARFTARARDARARAAVPATAAKAWWKASPEFWEEIKDEAHFDRVVNESGFELVLVDWYGTWCVGCERAFPELTRMAASNVFGGRVRFVKACIDGLKPLSRREGVKVLPQIGLYRPGAGRLLAFQAVPSRLKLARRNIETVLDNPGKFFRLDPNGVAVVLDTDPAGDEGRAAADAARLAAATGGLFERLMASTGGSESGSGNGRGAQSPSSGSAGANGAAATPSAVRSTAERTGAAANGARRLSGTVAPASANTRSMGDAKRAFLAQWGRDYGYGGRIDALYEREVAPRMAPHEHYLDYTGSSLYCSSVLENVFDDLQGSVFGNPHSANPSSVRTTERVDAVRDTVLRYFNADPAEYQCVWTTSATGALKTVGESFPWLPGSVFRYTRVNHNSVLGIREYATHGGARFQAVEDDAIEAWLGGSADATGLIEPAEGAPGDEPTRSLFAFPAEDNFAGVKYPLRWVREIQAMSTPDHEWKVLLDAAAFAPTQPLDLAATPADFVSVSFYKMFGYPTGLGALLIRTDAVAPMRKVFWGGGTVALATSGDDFHVLKCRPSDKFEDGTLAFLDVVALGHSFAFAEAALGGVARIQRHVHTLTRHAAERLGTARHSNGAPLVELFGRHGHASPGDVQGGILNFEVLDPRGAVVSYRRVEEEAGAAGFHIRTGVLCNPGAAYHDVGVTEAEVESLAGDKEGCGDEVDFIDVERPVAGEGTAAAASEGGGGAREWVRRPLGSVRASLGSMSRFEDVEAFVRFLEATYTDRPADAE